jgi:hypothetical protein
LYSVSDHDVTLGDFINTLFSDPWFWYQGLTAMVISTCMYWFLLRFANYVGGSGRVVLAAASPIGLLIVILATFGAILGRLEAIVPHFAAPGGLLTVAGLFAFGLSASLLAARLLRSPLLGSTEVSTFE